jgi:peroxiredoxin
MFCREQVVQLRDGVGEIRKAGAELVVVGNGRPEHALDFRSEYELDFPLVVDPELHAYRAAGLRRGVLDALGPRTLGNALRAWRRGARQGAAKGDPWQLGGTFVIRAGGRVVYRHVSREAGDHPPLAEILAAMRDVPA